MKIIENKIIPFPGYKLMNILGLVFSRVKEALISITEKRHEQTHTYQQYELLTIAAIVSLVFCNIYNSWWYLVGVVLCPFVIYVLGWLLEIVLPPYHNVQFGFEDGDSIITKCRKVWSTICKVCHDAYRDNCFEREANANEHDEDYFVTRRWCAWVWYILKRSERKK